VDLLKEKIEALKQCFPHSTSVDYKMIDRLCKEIYEMGMSDGYSQVWRAHKSGRVKTEHKDLYTRTATTNPNSYECLVFC